jgi:histone deacetylase 1/2
MKPTRIRMCHSLVMNYGLYMKTETFVGPTIPAVLAAHPEHHDALYSSTSQPQASHEAQDVSVPHGRIRRLPVLYDSRQRPPIRQGASEVRVATRLSLLCPLAWVLMIADNVGDDCPIFHVTMISMCGRRI